MTFSASGLQMAGLIVSLLAGSGALSFFMRYGVRLAIVEKTAREAHEDSKQNGKDIAATKERVSLVEKTLQDIANALSKLNSIDEIRANVSVMKDTVSDRFKDMVARSEHEARWKAQDDRMDDLKGQLEDLREELRAK